MTHKEAFKKFSKFTLTEEGFAANPHYEPTPEMAERDRQFWEEQDRRREARKLCFAMASAMAPAHIKSERTPSRFPVELVGIAVCLAALFAALWWPQ